MARRRRRYHGFGRHRGHRRHRRFGDPVISMPKVGDPGDLSPFGKTINSTDVMVGAGIGLAGGGLVMYGIRNFWPTAPAIITQYGGALSAVAAGFGAYTLFRRKSKPRAQGYLAGAVAVGVVPAVWGAVKAALPSSARQYFGDPVISMPSFRGLLTRSPGPMAGLLTSSPGPMAGLLTASPGPGLAVSSPARRAMGF